MNKKYQSQIELELLDALYSIKMKPSLETCGICDNVKYLLIKLGEDNERKVNRILRDLFKSWPKFSGDNNYPIPGGYSTFNTTSDKWEGEYGNLRKKLLDFLIYSLENKI